MVFARVNPDITIPKGMVPKKKYDDSRRVGMYNYTNNAYSHIRYLLIYIPNVDQYYPINVRKRVIFED